MLIQTIISHIQKKFKKIQRPRAITEKDITLFFRQFATLISAGIPIIQSCDILEKSQDKHEMRLLVYALKRELICGKTLATSLQNHSHYFNEIICQLTYIGEQTGKLDLMLNAIAQYQEKNFAFKQRLQQTLFYPCIIAIFSFLVTFSMFIFVIPQFAELFHDAQDLPALTKWIFYFSAFLKQYSYLFVIGLFILLILLSQKKISQHFMQQMRLFLKKFPLIKQCVTKMMLARFARNLAITFSAGIPIIEGLKLTVTSEHPTEFTQIVTRLRNKISSGLPLHNAMQMFPVFPLLMIQMIKIGEESGMLEHMLDKITEFLESEVEQFLHRLSQLLEPLIMVVLGVLIGGLVIGMYLPIFKLGNVISS